MSLKVTTHWRLTSIIKEAQQSVTFYRRWKKKGENRQNRTTAAGCYLATRQALQALQTGTIQNFI